MLPWQSCLQSHTIQYLWNLIHSGRVSLQVKPTITSPTSFPIHGTITYLAFTPSNAEMTAGIICSSSPFVPGLLRQKEVRAYFSKLLPRKWWPSSSSSEKKKHLLQQSPQSPQSPHSPQHQQVPIRSLHLGWTQDTDSFFQKEERSAEVV